MIGSAQGLLTHRNHYDSDRAFTALRTASQHNNVKLRDLARHLIDAHDRNDLGEAAVAGFGLVFSPPAG